VIIASRDISFRIERGRGFEKESVVMHRDEHDLKDFGKKKALPDRNGVALY
jgi:hypothetical protein